MNWDWLVGFIDGEGCIRAKRIYHSSTHNREGYYLMPQLHIANTNEKTIRLIHEFVGCGFVEAKVRNRTAHKTCYEFTLHAAAFKKVAFEIVPRLVTKRSQGYLAYYLGTMRGVDLMRKRNTGRAGSNPTVAPIMQIEKFIDECLRAINHRGNGGSERLARVEAAFGLSFDKTLADAKAVFDLGPPKPDSEFSETLASELGLI